jgi:hypothetical protein
VQYGNSVQRIIESLFFLQDQYLYVFLCCKFLYAKKLMKTRCVKYSFGIAADRFSDTCIRLPFHASERMPSNMKKCMVWGGKFPKIYIFGRAKHLSDQPAGCPSNPSPPLPLSATATEPFFHPLPQ